MKLNLGVFVVIFGVYISGVYLIKNSEEDAYNEVHLDFNEDPCGGWYPRMPDYTKPGRRISQVKCMEYIWRVKYLQGRDINEVDCAYLRDGTVAVLGGSSAIHGEYPHMAALGWKAKVGTWIFKCGSSLISEKFVLTAAHCSRVPRTDLSVAEVEPKVVRLGSKSILDTVSGRAAYDVNILRFIKHHRYNPLRQYFDIALVELAEETRFNYKVHPACLWNKFENPEKGMLTGWGVIEIGTLKTTPELQKAEIRIMDSNVCDEKLKIRRNRKWQGIRRHQLCAGDNTGKIDTCQGDSGGPLQHEIGLRVTSKMAYPWNVHQIVGVTSFGFGCARKDTPSIYTRVASFVGWIENIVWPVNTTLHEDRFLFAT